jgi:Fe-S-cluster containining protein
MPLSDEDIRRIVALGHQQVMFTVERGEIKHLRNRRGKCIFLGDGCTIYQDRPEGCRLYPVVYESVENRAVLDEGCPHRKEFRVTFKKSKQVSRLYRSLMRR